jgi:hypothetical protein
MSATPFISPVVAHKRQIRRSYTFEEAILRQLADKKWLFNNH